MDRVKKIMNNNIKLKTQEQLINELEGKEFDYKKSHDGWDLIFHEIENSLHSDLPIRVKNWLRNKFYSPVKR